MILRVHEYFFNVLDYERPRPLSMILQCNTRQYIPDTFCPMDTYLL